MLGEFPFKHADMSEGEKRIVASATPSLFSAVREQLLSLMDSEYGEALWEAYVNETAILGKMNINVRPLSKEYASWFACTPRLPEDRPLDYKRMVEILISTQFGFIPMFWAVGILPDGRAFGLNGKRTSFSFASIPEHIKEGMVVVLIEHYVNTMEDLLKLWSLYDKIGMSMTSGTVYKATAASLTELKLLSTRTLCSVVTVLGMCRFETQFRNLTPEQRKFVIKPHLDFLHFLDSLILRRASGGKLNQSRLLSRPALPVIYDSWLIDQQESWKFWTMVRDAVKGSEHENDLAGALHRYLRDVKTGAANQNVTPRPSTRSNTFHAPAPFVEAVCAHAWNMWRTSGLDNHLPHIESIIERPGPEGAGHEKESSIRPVLV